MHGGPVRLDVSLFPRYESAIDDLFVLLRGNTRDNRLHRGSFL
jgi:hypothetical protein